MLHVAGLTGRFSIGTVRCRMPRYTSSRIIAYIAVQFLELKDYNSIDDKGVPLIKEKSNLSKCYGTVLIYFILY